MYKTDENWINIQDAYISCNTMQELMQYKEKADAVGNLGPVTGAGFFAVEKSTLTAMVSTLLTYFIILIQFQP